MNRKEVLQSVISELKDKDMRQNFENLVDELEYEVDVSEWNAKEDPENVYFSGRDLKVAKRLLQQLKSEQSFNKMFSSSNELLSKLGINEAEELGSWTKEMLKPENLIGPFSSTEEMMKSLWDEE